MGLLLTASILMAQDYTANDFDRLINENPLVVIGQIWAQPVNGDTNILGNIFVEQVVTNRLNAEVGIGDEIPLKSNPDNAGWLSAEVDYKKGLVGLWIIKCEAQNNKVLPGDVVFLYIMPEAQAAALTGTEPPKRKGYWGITKFEQTRAYGKDGKAVPSINAGVIMFVDEIVNTKSGEVAMSRPADQPNAKQVLIRTHDMMIYPGELSEVDQNGKELCIREAVVSGKIEIAKQKLADEAAKKNPYNEEYRKCKAASDAYWEKVNKLQVLRDSATGAAKTKYTDELRQMKGEDIRLAQDLKAIKAKFDDWAKKNPVNKSQLTNPEIQALEKELSEIQK